MSSAEAQICCAALVSPLFPHKALPANPREPSKSKLGPKVARTRGPPRWSVAPRFPSLFGNDAVVASEKIVNLSTSVRQLKPRGPKVRAWTTRWVIYCRRRATRRLAYRAEHRMAAEFWSTVVTFHHLSLRIHARRDLNYRASQSANHLLFILVTSFTVVSIISISLVI